MVEGIQHHNPIGKSDYLSVQHVERYWYAISQLCPNQKVLDIAAGAGYGTAMLRNYGCDVIGVDYDDKGLATARSVSKLDCFVRADALNLPFKDNSFDSVVSFETIEHVHDGALFLSEMYRVLQPGGIFICSTPNIAYTVHPPYHVKEYEPGEFYELVEQRFQSVERYGQYFKCSDRLRDLYQRHVLPRLKQSISKVISYLKPPSCVRSKLRWYMYDRWIFNKISVKKVPKRGLQPIKLELECSAENNVVPMELSKAQAVQEGSDNFYSVRTFDGSKLLRIMVVVAKKKEKRT